jgi:hypothetical protein
VQSSAAKLCWINIRDRETLNIFIRKRLEKKSNSLSYFLVYINFPH